MEYFLWNGALVDAYDKPNTVKQLEDETECIARLNFGDEWAVAFEERMTKTEAYKRAIEYTLAVTGVCFMNIGNGMAQINIKPTFLGGCLFARLTLDKTPEQRRLCIEAEIAELEARLKVLRDTLDTLDQSI